MYIHGEEIRLDPDVSKVEVEEDDWSINRREHLMAHRASHVIFHIGLDETAAGKETVSLFDYVARPVYIHSGHTLPAQEEMLLLGRNAILLFLEEMGCLKPEHTESKPISAPDLNVN